MVFVDGQLLLIGDDLEGVGAGQPHLGVVVMEPPVERLLVRRPHVVSGDLGRLARAFGSRSDHDHVLASRPGRFGACHEFTEGPDPCPLETLAELGEQGCRPVGSEALGEVFELGATEVVYEILPNALEVIVPRDQI